MALTWQLPSSSYWTHKDGRLLFLPSNCSSIWFSIRFITQIILGTGNTKVKMFVSLKTTMAQGKPNSCVCVCIVYLDTMVYASAAGLGNKLRGCRNSGVHVMSELSWSELTLLWFNNIESTTNWSIKMLSDIKPSTREGEVTSCRWNGFFCEYACIRLPKGNPSGWVITREICSGQTHADIWKWSWEVRRHLMEAQTAVPWPVFGE